MRAEPVMDGPGNVSMRCRGSREHRSSGSRRHCRSQRHVAVGVDGRGEGGRLVVPPNIVFVGVRARIPPTLPLPPAAVVAAGKKGTALGQRPWAGGQRREADAGAGASAADCRVVGLGAVGGMRKSGGGGGVDGPTPEGGGGSRGLGSRSPAPEQRAAKGRRWAPVPGQRPAGAALGRTRGRSHLSRQGLKVSWKWRWRRGGHGYETGERRGAREAGIHPVAAALPAGERGPGRGRGGSSTLLPTGAFRSV